MTTTVVRVGVALIKPVQKLFRQVRPKTDRTSVARHADDLAESVDQAEKQLQQELRAGLGSFMHVRFIAAAQVPSAQVVDSAEVDEIAVYFDLLEQPRRLVVLGEPGAGKTVAATYLVRGLLELRRNLLDTRRAVEQVPVRVNATGWDGEQDFSAWLVTRLFQDYRIPLNVGKEFVRRRLILPVLDGLDEMDDDTTAGRRARALLDRLNHRAWENYSVVVLCRSTTFENLKQQGRDKGLHGAAMLTLAPLSTDQVEDYLVGYQSKIGATDPAWDLIATHLREHPGDPLANALENPWLLGLTVTTLRYTPQDATALLDCTDVDAVREQLFTVQISAAIAGTDDTHDFRDYTTDNVERWMRSLARCLQHRRDTGRNGTVIRLDEIWEIAGTSKIRILHTLAVIFISAIVGGLAGTIAGALTDALMFGFAFGLMIGLAGGLANGLGAAITKYPTARRIAWKVPSRSRWKAGLTFPLAFGLTFGLAGGFAGGLAVGFTVGLVVGLVGGLAVGLAFGFTGGLETNAEDQLAMGTDERRLIRDDWQSALFTGALVGLAIGLTVGLAVGLADGPIRGVAFGAAGWLASWLAIGLTGGLATGRYFVAILVFKLTADFPDRPAAFLVWARNSGLLRVNADAYQFRHQTYQQWVLDQSRLSATDPAPAVSGQNPSN